MGQAFNILLVEDSADDALLFRMCAGKGAPVSITHVADAAQAIAHLEANQPTHLIVLDLKLPGMSTEEFIEWANRNPAAQGIPIVIYTGAMTVPEQVQKSVRGTFYKPTDFAKIPPTIMEMRRLAAN
jgi:CheY-like chemotaxis protein